MIPLSWLLWCAVIVSRLSQGICEFRFCYKGPHQIRHSVCPGGFLAFQPLNVSCVYYTRGSDSSQLAVRLKQNMCSDNELTLPHNEVKDASQVSQFHQIFFDSLAEGDEDSTPLDDIDDAVCADKSCLDIWKDQAEPEDEPMLLEQPPIAEKELVIYKQRYVKIAKELLLELTRDDLFDQLSYFNDTDEYLKYLLKDGKLQLNPGAINILRLLAKTFTITFEKCSPYIENKYLQQVFRGILFLNRKSRTHTSVEIDSVPFKRIWNHLQSCQKSTNTFFTLNGTDCGSMHVLDSAVDIAQGEIVWKYRRQARSFRWGVYDPLIESAWAAVDFVHGHCFHAFYRGEDVLHFHLYMSAMEALFPPEPVQTHWMYPVELKKDDKFWNRIMDTEDIKNQMRSLDGCVFAAYMAKSPFQERLLRPFVKEEEIENPEYDKDIDSERNNIRWRKSASEYWNWYERQGGFKEISKNFGFCLDGSQENLEEAERQLQEKGLVNC